MFTARQIAEGTYELHDVVDIFPKISYLKALAKEVKKDLSND
jgi:predicted transcriptional regulator with HTH domain